MQEYDPHFRTNPRQGLSRFDARTGTGVSRHRPMRYERRLGPLSVGPLVVAPAQACLGLERFLSRHWGPGFDHRLCATILVT